MNKCSKFVPRRGQKKSPNSGYLSQLVTDVRGSGPVGVGRGEEGLRVEAVVLPYTLEN